MTELLAKAILFSEENEYTPAIECLDSDVYDALYEQAELFMQNM